MKFRVTFKSPDALDEALNDVVASHRRVLEDQIDRGEIDADERADKLSDLREDLYGHAAQWISGGEYVTIEFDTELNTAVVLQRN